MTYKLFIDDERFPPDDNTDWVVARNMTEVKALVEELGMPSYISFDHDLGTDTEDGYDITKWLVGTDMLAGETKHLFPDDFEFYVHSQNPVGAENIRCYINNYIKQREHNGK